MHPHHKAALRARSLWSKLRWHLVNPIRVLQANLIVRCPEERFKKVRVLRRTNSDLEHVRMLAALDGIARRSQIGASHGS